MLIERIVTDRNAARVASAHREYVLLTYVYGELETSAKRKGLNATEVTDAEVIACLKKIIKGNNDVMKLVPQDDSEASVAMRQKTEAEVKHLTQENEILQKYLPVELTEDEIKAVLEDSVFGSVKEGLAALDAKHSGLYNKQAAVKLINSLL